MPHRSLFYVEIEMHSLKKSIAIFRGGVLQSNGDRGAHFAALLGDLGKIDLKASCPF